jgi:hypothetical protein
LTRQGKVEINVQADLLSIGDGQLEATRYRGSSREIDVKVKPETNVSVYQITLVC